MKMAMLYLLAILLVIIISLFSVLIYLSPGKPREFIDNHGNKLANSISEKIFLEINGTNQGMFIKGENLDNPIILYLHGGIPDYFLTEKYPTYLEINFTLVWWEQRGCGLSYNSNLVDIITIDQLIDDTITLTKYLIKRFNKQRIYLMGHSGGTFLGIYAIDKAPELYYAYIGIAQMSDQRKSELLAFNYLLKQNEEIGDQKKVNILQKIHMNESEELPEEYIKIRDIAMHDLGVGTMRNMKNLFKDLILPSFLFSEYTIFEKFNLWMSKSKSGVSQNWNNMINTNLMEIKTSFKVPVYFIHGIYDYTCSYQLAKEYFDKVVAPQKGFYTFHNSAHSPLFEEPQKLNEILAKDVANLKNELADKVIIQ